MFSFINQYVCPMGFPRGSVVQNLPANAGRYGFDSWVRKIPRSRKWQPTAVFLPGKSHGQRSLVGHSPWGCKKLDTTTKNNNIFALCLLKTYLQAFKMRFALAYRRSSKWSTLSSTDSNGAESLIATMDHRYEGQASNTSWGERLSSRLWQACLFSREERVSNKTE